MTSISYEAIQSGEPKDAMVENSSHRLYKGRTSVHFIYRVSCKSLKRSKCHPLQLFYPLKYCCTQNLRNVVKCLVVPKAVKVLNYVDFLQFVHIDK